MAASLTTVMKSCQGKVEEMKEQRVRLEPHGKWARNQQWHLTHRSNRLRVLQPFRDQRIDRLVEQRQAGWRRRESLSSSNVWGENEVDSKRSAWPGLSRRSIWLAKAEKWRA
jgi:hypothetical protein